MADGGRVEGRAEVDGRLRGASVVEVGEAHERLQVAIPGRLDDCGELGGEAGIQICGEDEVEQVDTVDLHRNLPAVRLRRLAVQRLRAELVGERDDVRGE